jgi:hypothetical protein
MPRKDGMTPIHILVNEENRSRINAFAAKKGHKVTADYIRSLIEADMKADGEDIDLSVDRGGWRRGKETNDEE